MNSSRVDVVVIGGGVAGLWCRWKLSRAGYSVVVLERSRLGDGQTVASQGILHRGVKYALSAEASRAAAAAEDSARQWDQAMSGDSGPDLSGLQVVAPSMLMWTDGGLLSKLTGAVASKVLTSHVGPAIPAEVPPFLAQRGRSVYRIGETVIDPVSALRCLQGATSGPVVQTTVQSIAPYEERVIISTDAGILNAGIAVLCAGEGNAGLLGLLGEDPARWMQLRDLHMVSVAGTPGPIFGHWVASASDKPRLSITSARVDGEWHWYLGGSLAETGVARSAEDQIQVAKAELAACFPTLQPGSWEYRTLRIARAEGKDDAGKRPDAPVVRPLGTSNAIAVWPTKLVMAPAAADLVLQIVSSKLGPTDPTPTALGGAPHPDYALIPWLPRT